MKIVFAKRSTHGRVQRRGGVSPGVPLHPLLGCSRFGRFLVRQAGVTCSGRIGEMDKQPAQLLQLRDLRAGELHPRLQCLEFAGGSLRAGGHLAQDSGIVGHVRVLGGKVLHDTVPGSETA